MSVPLLEPVVTDTPRLRVSSPMFDIIANRSMNFSFNRLTNLLVGSAVSNVVHGEGGN